MRVIKTLTLVAVSAAASVALISTAPAQDTPSMCQVMGNWAGWGQNGTGSFDVGSGRSCLIGASTFGNFEGSKIAKKPAHGTVKQLSVSSWQYTSKPGFTGADTFVIEGTGRNPSQAAGQRSQITMTANVR